MRLLLLLAVFLSFIGAVARADLLSALVAIEEKDFTKAIVELEPLAQKGEAQSQYLLGKIFLEGHGPVASIDEGVELIRKSAEQNYGPAQAMLGYLYAKGIGVAPDEAQAREWLTRSLERLGQGAIRRQAESNLESLGKPTTPTEPTTIDPATIPVIENTPTIVAMPEIPKNPPNKKKKKLSKPKKIKTASPPQISAIRIQLAAFPNLEQAEQEWQKLLTQNNDLFASLDPVFNKIDLGQGGVFYRLQASPFQSLAEARSLCEKFVIARQSCLVIDETSTQPSTPK